MINKQTVSISFKKGIQTKVDPFQLSIGDFLSLQNAVFTKEGLLQKRNGYASLASLPDTSYSYATTFNGNLTAIGNNLAAYSSGSDSWIPRGSIQPVSLNTTPLIRSNTNQSTCDAVVNAGGIACLAYTDQDPADLSSHVYRYALVDSVTGQNLVSPVTLTATGGPKVFLLGNQFIVVYPNGSALDFVSINASTFVPVAPVTISSLYTDGKPFDAYVANGSLYVAWSYGTTPAVKVAYIDAVLSVHTAISFTSHDASAISVTADTSQPTPVIWVTWFYVGDGNGYAAAVNPALVVILNPTQIISSAQVISITSAASGNVCSFFYENLNTYTYDQTLRTDYIQKNTIDIAGTLGVSIGSAPIMLRSVGLGSRAFYVGSTIYMLCAYGSSYQPTYFLSDSNGNLCLKLAYSNGGGYYGALLPGATVNGSTVYISYLFKDLVVPVNKARNAPASSAIFSQTGINLAAISISSATLNGAEIGQNLNLSGGFVWSYDGSTPVEQGFHLWPDDVELSGSGVSGNMVPQQYFYAVTYEWSDNQGNVFRSAPSIQTSITLIEPPPPVTFTADTSSGSPTLTSVSSTAGLTVGYGVTGSGIPAGANIASIDAAHGQITIDANATATASAVSISTILVGDTTSGSPILTSVTPTPALQVGQQLSGTGIPSGAYIVSLAAGTLTMSANATATNTAVSITLQAVTSIAVNVPTLRLTYKIANPAKLVVYRWSTAQQTFYQTTSVSTPILNDPTVDSIMIVDSNIDGDILGNAILYTTGGVVENIGPPPTPALALYKSRLFLIDAEDKNLLWYSKQVIESTPVEMSDLFTIYVAPTVSSEGSTGPMTALAAMDDKLIIFKQNAAYYITGTGPDNTGANNDFSDPTFITSNVGCANPRSIAFIPGGLMFQSNKGIWLLGRDLNTSYIGAPVEVYNDFTVLSAVALPGTNQVLFTLSNGVTLMYDFFFSQWSTFSGVPAVSSTLFQGLHTFINQYGSALQQSPGKYVDGSSPVLLSFTTSWLNLAGLQGYQRAYFFYLLGTYYSPHKLSVQIAYDYNPSPSQGVLITPSNYNGPYGLSPGAYGANSPYGGTPVLEQWKVFLQRQTCQSFQISVSESFDPFFGTAAGGGLTLSGIDIQVGIKKGYRPIRAANATG